MSKVDPNYDRSFALKWIDLAQARLGGEALYCTDDFFALSPGWLSLIWPAI